MCLHRLCNNPTLLVFKKALSGAHLVHSIRFLKSKLSAESDKRQNKQNGLFLSACEFL